MVLAGKSEDDETNQSCSTNVDNNRFSTKIYFDLRNMNHFQTNREHESLSNCQATNSVREIVAEDPETIIEENPLLIGKLNFPSNPANSDDCSPSSVLDFSLFTTANEISGTPVKILEDPNQISKGKSCRVSDEVPSPASESCLPQKVVLTLNDCSPPTSMDFHPYWHFILLVGTEIGSVRIWDLTVASGKELLSINFEVWKTRARSTNFKAAIEKDLWISVNKVIWSSDGSMFGVAFSKHLVHLYSFVRLYSRNGERKIDISRHMEIEAHDSSVNDIAFYLVRGQLLVITCGDDKAVKVWDAKTGEGLNTFEAHSASVCSICTHVKEYVRFIFSASIDGKIMKWLYNTTDNITDYDAPGCGYTKLAYSTDDQRLFSCGVIKDGEPFFAEWDENEGSIKRVYKGLKAPCTSKIQFDTTWNRFLAAGDDHMVKFWDMDNIQLLASTNANGELLAYPCLCFNKEGRLLAVAARESKIKILALDYDDIWNIFKISEPSQCQFLQLPVHQRANKIVRLIYTNAGKDFLALTSDGINILWKWPGKEQATSHDSPHLWQPGNGLQFMSNDLKNVRPVESIGCFAISNNDSYLISTSGGSISLFILKTFKTMATFMSPPPRATSFSFYPRDNNVVAVGCDDSSIFIYNVSTDKVLKKLRGHSTTVASLAFSNTLHVLVSAEANKIFLWNVEEWENLIVRRLQMAAGRKPEVPCDTHIQFHPQQINFLVVQDSGLAIYEAREFTLVKQWDPILPLLISQADFSADGTEIYVGFADGTIKILDASNLQPLCRIDPTAYLPPTSSESMYLVAMAANPVKAGQFAVGLSDGNVYVMEPPEAGLKWSTLVRDDDKEAAETSGVGDEN